MCIFFAITGPRYRKPKVPKDKTQVSDEKRPRTAFSSDQLARLKVIIYLYILILNEENKTLIG